MTASYYGMFPRFSSSAISADRRKHMDISLLDDESSTKVVITRRASSTAFTPLSFFLHIVRLTLILTRRSNFIKCRERWCAPCDWSHRSDDEPSRHRQYSKYRGPLVARSAKSASDLRGAAALSLAGFHVRVHAPRALCRFSRRLADGIVGKDQTGRSGMERIPQFCIFALLLVNTRNDQQQS